MPESSSNSEMEKKPTVNLFSIDFWVERKLICNKNCFWIKPVPFESSTDISPYNKSTMDTYYWNGKWSSKYVQRNKKFQYQAFKSDQVFGAHLFLVVLLKTSYTHLFFSTCQSSHPHPLKMTKHNTDLFLNQIHRSLSYFGSCGHNFQCFMGWGICFCSLPVCLDCKTFEENSMFSFVLYTIPCTMLVNKQACEQKNKFHLKHAEYLRL